MGKRGPAKKPSAIEKLQGMPGRRPLNPKEPKPEVGLPKCPGWLDGIAKYCFKEVGKQLKDVKVITANDKKALEIMADAYSEYRRARAIVLKEGHTVTLYIENKRSGEILPSKIILRPEVKIAQNAWRRFADMLKQFGLTPSSRRDVDVLANDSKDPFEEFLEKGSKLRSVK